MNTIASIAVFLTMVIMVSAQQHHDPKSDVAGRTHADIAARINLGTAISLVVPIALGVALVALLAPIFQGLFASPIPFSPSLGYGRKSKSLFSGFNQETVMQVLDTLTKAIDAYAEADNDKAKPKF